MSGIVTRDLSTGQHSGGQTYMTGDMRTCVIIGTVSTDHTLTDTTELMTVLS